MPLINFGFQSTLNKVFKWFLRPNYSQLSIQLEVCTVVVIISQILSSPALAFPSAHSSSLPSALSPTQPFGVILESPLSRDQIKSFRSWIVTLVEDQVSRGANPRWKHRDCAGLLRFAVAETLATHDQKWRKANGFLGRPLPAEIEMNNHDRQALRMWKSTQDEKSFFVRALPLIQNNSEYLGKTVSRIEPGDLLFFDQGDEQHLMIWTGNRIVYHNGSHQKPNDPDNGLRAVTLKELSRFSDSRWNPTLENPNFVGFYRLSFLAHQGNP